MQQGKDLEKRVKEGGAIVRVGNFVRRMIRAMNSAEKWIYTKPRYSLAVLAVLAGGIAALVSVDEQRTNNLPRFVEPDFYRIEQHEVDQVFRDHDGFRVYFDNVNGEYVERKYYDDGEVDYLRYSDIPFPIINEESRFKGIKEGDKHVKVYRDLPEGEHGYLQMVRYKKHGRPNLAEHTEPNLYYVEIHLPENQQLSPGNETYGGKFPIHSPMSEVK